MVPKDRAGVAKSRWVEEWGWDDDRHSPWTALPDGREEGTAKHKQHPQAVLSCWRVKCIEKQPLP